MKRVTTFALISAFLLAFSFTIYAQNTPQAIFDRAVKDFNEKKFEPAEHGFLEVVKLAPQNAEAHFYLGSTFYELKKTDQAITELNEAIRLKPNFAEAHFVLAKIYFEQGEYETSLPLVEKANKLNNKMPPAMILLGDNYRVLGKLNNAVVPYQRAIGFDDKNPHAYYGLGLTYIDLNNKIAARQQHKKLQALDKDLAQKLLDLINR